MEFTKEFIEEHKLSEEQVTAITGHITTDYIPTLKKEWDGIANQNAEKIIDGAASYAATKAGVELQRDQGEKYGDYLNRIAEKKLESASSALQTKQSELDEKLKNFKGGDEYKSQIDSLLQEKDELQKQVAELDPLKGFDKKLEEKEQELSSLKRQVAYGAVKPNFPDTVNKFEADAKWSNLVKRFEDKYILELVDNEAIGIDKDNKHKQVKLSQFISQDAEITELLKGREQGGTGAKPTETHNIDGVPFPVPVDATTKDRAEAIEKYLLSLNLVKTSLEYSKQFTEYNTKILAQKKAA